MTEVPESIPFQPGGCKIQAMGSGTVKERKKTVASRQERYKRKDNENFQ